MKTAVHLNDPFGARLLAVANGFIKVMLTILCIVEGSLALTILRNRGNFVVTNHFLTIYAKGVCSILHICGKTLVHLLCIDCFGE